MRRRRVTRAAASRSRPDFSPEVRTKIPREKRHRPERRVCSEHALRELLGQNLPEVHTEGVFRKNPSLGEKRADLGQKKPPALMAEARATRADTQTGRARRAFREPGV